MRFLALLCALTTAAFTPEFVPSTAGCVFRIGSGVNLHLATRRSRTAVQESSEGAPAFSLTVEPFEFHSGFWMNLHHFLYAQALPPGRYRPMFPEMPASNKKIWDEAVGFYREHIVQRDFVLDDQLQRINSYLGKMENASAISGDAIGTDVSSVLTSAAPIYKHYWWARHDAANRFWIKMTQPLVASLGQQVRGQLAGAYETEWPAKLVRVDVSVYASWAGAYTNIVGDDQIHTVMSSESPGNQGFAALETLFHEASHGLVHGRSGTVAGAIQIQAKAHNIPVPENLWHAVIFYTVGEFVRRDLDRVGVHDYQPYAEKQGVWDRGWQSYRSVLGLYWRAHMDGNLSLNEAMSQMMGALAVTRSQ